MIRSVAAGATVTVIAGNTEVGALYGTFAFLRRMQTQQADHEPRRRSSPKIKNRHLNNWEGTRLYAGNNATGTGGLNGENGTIFNFAATGASAGRNLPVILDRYIVVARALASRRDQRHQDQPRQRQQRLPDAGVHRAGGGAGRRAAPVRHQALAGDQLHGADRQPVRAGHADQPAARPLRRAVPRLVDAQGAAAAGVDPGLHGLHRQGQLRGPAGPAGLRLRPRRRRQRHRGGGRAAGHEGLLAHVRLQRQRRQRPAQARLPGVRLHRRRAPAGRHEGSLRTTCSCRPRTARWTSRRASRSTRCSAAWRTPTRRSSCRSPRSTPARAGCSPTSAPMWEEVLKTDTYATDAPGAARKRLVGDIVDGTAQGHADTAIVGVANLGNADNLTGHHFAQANLFAFGRQAWDWTLGSEDIARGLGADDLEQRRRRGRHDRGDDDGLLGGARELPDAARRRAPVHLRATTTAPTRASGSPRTTGAPSTTTRPTAPAWASTAPPTGSNFVAQYFPTLAAALREHRDRRRRTC